MGGPGVPPPPLPLPLPLPLLLPLLLPGPPASALWLLHFPTPNCSQPGLDCNVKNSTCLHRSWHQPPKWTPTAPRRLSVTLGSARVGAGDLYPVLEITWTVATDGSIVCLRGAELAVLQVSTNEVLCAEFEFPDSPPDQVGPDRNPWRFSFNRFVVEPGQLYEVTVHHLPKLGTDGDDNHHSKRLRVPDCGDPKMRTTTPCVVSGSLWEPDLTAERLENRSLRVTFTPWTEASAHYQILVDGFPETSDKSCHQEFHPVAPVERPPRRLSVTVPLGSVRACCRYTVQIQPFFQSCGSDCIRHVVTVPSRGLPPTLFPPPLTPPVEYPSDDVSLWVYWVITCVCVLLVGSVILTAVCVAQRKPGSGSGKSTDAAVYSGIPPPAPASPPPLKPRKVWVVYSADHPLYVDVVVKFAQFLLTACGTEVALDLLEEREISEVGALAWITRQKRAADAGASKIVVLCSRGTRAKWQAMLGRGGPAAGGLRGDRRRPAGDLFTPALNVILPDFKRPARFGGYVVCYFSDICAEEDVPEPFLITSRYPLMGAFEEVYFRIQDLEMFQPGRGHRVRELSADGYLGGPAGRGLEEAVRRFREWQAAHPDWFERENGGASDEEEEEEEERIPPGGEEATATAVVRQEPLLREPGLAEGFRVDPLPTRTDGGAFRVAPRPPAGPGPAPSALQTPVAADERRPPSLAVTPVPRAAATAGRLVPVEEEGRPLLDPVAAAPAVGPPSPLPPGRLEEWVRSLLGPGEGETRTPAGGEQRQSVQSDQGYISRSSPQPPDGPEEDEEEEDDDDDDGEGEDLEEPLSPAILASLKNLQQHLLFHHLRQESGQTPGARPAPS